MKLLRSFGYAWKGIRYCFSSQLNFRIHLLVLSLVILAGFMLGISRTEWLFITVSAMVVLSLELLNTAVEYLCDLVSKEFHPLVKIIKDVAAAAVLISAIGSAVIGCLVFFPKLLELFKS